MATLMTERLEIISINSDFDSLKKDTLVTQLPDILTENVVENLPPYFHDLTTKSAAKEWLNKMLSESQLYLVRSIQTGEALGFLFTYEGCDGDVHIGFLLGEPHWQKGFAKELLKAFIEFALTQTSWKRLVGGVDSQNQASAGLLTKLGFKKLAAQDSNVVFFEYILS